MSVIPKSFSLLKRSNGVYYVIYHEGGRQRWKSTGKSTKPEALKALTDFQALLSERKRYVSFAQFCTQFLSYAETNLSPKTLKIYEVVFKRFHSIIREATLNEITAETLDKFKSKRMREVSPVSVNVDLRTLKAAFATAKRWGLIVDNPFDMVTLARVPEQTPLHLSREDLQRLLSCIKEGWFRDVVFFAVLTGLRRGEILNLSWSAVDMPRKLIHVQTTATWKTKGGKRRTMPLNELAVNILKLRQGKSPSEFVFTLNDKKLSGGWVTHLFKRYVREAQLENQRARFHSLRHTFASFLLDAKVPIYEVQKLLGHSSVAVTEVYSHMPSEEMHETVNKLTLN